MQASDAFPEEAVAGNPEKGQKEPLPGILSLRPSPAYLQYFLKLPPSEEFRECTLGNPGVRASSCRRESLICMLPETEVEDEFFLPDSLARRVECWDFQLAPETKASGPLMKLAKRGGKKRNRPQTSWAISATLAGAPDSYHSTI
ncbi:uncharacterized protein ACBT57_027081 [Dama dama]